MFQVQREYYSKFVCEEEHLLNFPEFPSKSYTHDGGALLTMERAWDLTAEDPELSLGSAIYLDLATWLLTFQGLDFSSCKIE